MVAITEMNTTTPNVLFGNTLIARPIVKRGPSPSGRAWREAPGEGGHAENRIPPNNKNDSTSFYHHRQNPYNSTALLAIGLCSCSTSGNRFRLQKRQS
jgi:hypothetical protein